MAISHDRIKSEAYVSSGADRVLALAFEGPSQADFTLMQNYPNPFDRETYIRFYLPQTHETTLSVYDINGRLLYSFTSVGLAGLNEWKISNIQMRTDGLLYYRLDSGQYSSTRKMLMMTR